MHYSDKIGSINPRVVFRSRQPCPNNDCKFGQREQLSPMDIKDIEDAYNCGKYQPIIGINIHYPWHLT